MSEATWYVNESLFLPPALNQTFDVWPGAAPVTVPETTW